jgi:hypothetical protein
MKAKLQTIRSSLYAISVSPNPYENANCAKQALVLIDELLEQFERMEKILEQ